MTTSAVTDLRPLMLSIAYRMVGRVSEAEDIVQEAFLRFHRATSAGEAVESPRAWLSTTTTRLAIDHLRSARVRRESYVGAWLPEPLLADPAPDASRQAELADSFSLAVLVLLESLTPVERAVLVLHDVFGYGYDETAEIVGRTEDNCRQLAVRARRHVEERKPRFEASREHREELARRFFAAAEEGDTAGLVELLAADVVMYGDGGGKAPARATPLRGAEKVARFLLGLGRQGERMGIRVRHVEVNGMPGALYFDAEGRLVTALSLDVADGAIQAIRSIVNPDKLAHLGPTGDLAGMLSAPREGPTPSG